jgi:hypothetical protein
MVSRMKVRRGSLKGSGKEWEVCFSNQQQVCRTGRQYIYDRHSYKISVIRAMGSCGISIEWDAQRYQRLSRQTSKMHDCNGSHFTGTRRNASVDPRGQGRSIYGMEQD